MNGTIFTDIERLARQQIHDRTTDAARHRSRQPVRESYVNLIPTSAGGTHESGLRDGLFNAVKSFIELHGGRVTLDSAPNEGTRVTCYLPVLAAGATSTGAFGTRD